MTTATLDLFSSFVHLTPGGQMQAGPQVFDPGREGWQVMAFQVETGEDVHAGHWEVHTEADELVSCLSGGIRLYFRPEAPGGEEEEIAVPAGRAVIVPRGRWHRIELDGPSHILSVTLPRGSRLEKR
ncbi:cupin domain-containing protein [Longispora albida]|uniref:cupin domain-containing protein n=1 Tax=Longispora albida TaxID=203523 RepID=UPI00035F0E15|nr:cupin domain-containing protein [Longispora albida]